MTDILELVSTQRLIFLSYYLGVIIGLWGIS